MASFNGFQDAFLLRKKNMEKVLLNKPIFRLGRERSYVDYFICDNATVSRVHAQIENRDGTYTITDRNALNHTYVNDECLPSGKSHPLRSGDVIRLGSEVFEFRVDVRTFHAAPLDTATPLYRALYEGLEQMQPRIICPVSSPEIINETLHKILLEHPQLCYFEGDWTWDGAVVPTYTLSTSHADQLRQRVDMILNRLQLPASPLEKAAVIYDWLAANVQYDRFAPNSQNAYGALVEGRALCKGIAKAFQLLLSKVNILCQLVEGTLDGQTKHVWNQFCVDDLWYHSDVTMAYPQFAFLAAPGMGNFKAVPLFQILATHTIWDGEKKKTFFQSLQNQRLTPHHPLQQPPRTLQRHLQGIPQFLAAGSVSDVYHFGSVVLKRIYCGDDPAKLYYATREQSMLQKLEDANQVARLRAWDVVREPDGYTVYLVLEYSQSMEDYCSSKTDLTPKDAVNLVHSACLALQQCYLSGVAHLDVQPGNLLVTPIGIVKLTDFSSAVPVWETENLTDLRGTPAYMAPEVYHRRAYSQAADVYSLGILLYSLLCGGKLPYGDVYPPHEATQKRMDGLPVKLSGHSPELCALVEKACSFDPAQRYPDLQNFTMALESILWSLKDQPAPRPYAPTMPSAPSLSRPASAMPSAPSAARPAPPAPNPAAKAPASKGGLFSGLRNPKKKSQSAAVPPAPVAPSVASAFTPPPAPVFRADTFGESTVLSAPVYRPEPPAPSATPSLWNIPKASPAPAIQADSFGSTAVPSAPAIQANSFGSTLAPAAPASQPAADPVRVDKVQFSAVAPQKATKGEYTIVQLFMYEQAFRNAVDEALEMGEGPMQEKKTGIYQVKDNTRVKVVLTSPDIEILDDTAEETWQGGYLCFDFALDIPQDLSKKQILLKAAVYFDDIPATRLMMTLRLQTQHEQRMEVLRSDVLSAFVSYASQDRSRVGGLIQGMKKARPDMDIFFDVNSLRSGENWEDTLRREVERRDILFLCWSKHAKESPWVDMEWRYAMESKGIESIEPIPIDPPDVCPPPQELQSKHFNDSLLYIINTH